MSNSISIASSNTNAASNNRPQENISNQLTQSLVSLSQASSNELPQTSLVASEQKTNANKSAKNLLSIFNENKLCSYDMLDRFDRETILSLYEAIPDVNKEMIDQYVNTKFFKPFIFARSKYQNINAKEINHLHNETENIAEPTKILKQYELKFLSKFDLQIFLSIYDALSIDIKKIINHHIYERFLQPFLNSLPKDEELSCEITKNLRDEIRELKEPIDLFKNPELKTIDFDTAVELISDRKFEVFELLFRLGTNFNINSEQKTDSLLHYAAIYGASLETIKMLLKAGADVNQLDDHLKSPLYLYMQNSFGIDINVVLLLLKETNTDLFNVPSHSGKRMLNWASIFDLKYHDGYPLVTRLCYERGALFNFTDNDNDTLEKFLAYQSEWDEDLEYYEETPVIQFIRERVAHEQSLEKVAE